MSASNRIRPSLIRNLPVLGFCLLGGFFGLFVDDFPVIGRVLGLMFAIAFVPFAALLLTTWFEFGDGVRVSTLGRVREFSVEESTLRLHTHAVGFFGESTAVELRSGEIRRTVSLAVFSPDDRKLIKRELRSRFRAAGSER